MIRRPPRSTRTDTLFPYTTLVRSTSGVVPMMARAGEEIGVNLAVSLHAVNKDVRDEIVPLNRKYGIEELLTACAAYPGANNARRITFEYVMLKDKRSEEHTSELQSLMRLSYAVFCLKKKIKKHIT